MNFLSHSIIQYNSQTLVYVRMVKLSVRTLDKCMHHGKLDPSNVLYSEIRVYILVLILL